jgi:hypothetical protein
VGAGGAWEVRLSFFGNAHPTSGYSVVIFENFKFWKFAFLSSPEAVAVRETLTESPTSAGVSRWMLQQIRQRHTREDL